MKKLLLNISLTLFSGWCSAQITFTSADLQEAGRTYVTKTDTLNDIALGNASATAQAWDFSSLVMHFMSGPSFDLTTNTSLTGDYPTSNLYTYGPAAMFGGFYGGAPVGSQGLDNGYMLWRKDATGFWTEGFMADEGSYAGKKVYTIPQEMILGTPATLGTNYSNLSEWTLSYSAVSTDVDTLYKSTVDKTQECDAWGSLVTPTATFPSVLRIHEHLVKVDSVFATLNGNPVYSLELLRDTLNNYIFVGNDIHYPIAIVKCDKNNEVQSVEYYFSQGLLSIDITIITSVGVTIFPNPTNGILEVQLDEAIGEQKSIAIFDSYGKMCSSEMLCQTNTKLDISHLNNGIYYYRIQTEKGVITGQFLKQ